MQLYDTKTLKLLKTFASDRPLNSASISPNMNHIILGGGQEAMNVTTTSAKVGHFEVDFHHLVYQTKLGSVKGHFGPVNTLAFMPDGKGYVKFRHVVQLAGSCDFDFCVRIFTCVVCLSSDTHPVVRMVTYDCITSTRTTSQPHSGSEQLVSVDCCCIPIPYYKERVWPVTCAAYIVCGMLGL